MKKIWVNKCGSFEAAQKFDAVYYQGLSSAERIETVQMLREAHFNSIGLLKGENGKRLRRFFKVIKQA